LAWNLGQQAIEVPLVHGLIAVLCVLPHKAQPGRCLAHGTTPAAVKQQQ
jgi:hypothetical protein